MGEKLLSVTVPDLGEAEGVEVVEVLVSVGQSVAENQSLVVLESDKASLEVPAPAAGTVARLHAAAGMEVTEGSLLLDLQQISAAEPKAEASSAAAAESAPVQEEEVTVTLPDTGDAETVEVVELLVRPGDKVKKNDSLLVVESDKASMEIPAPADGKVLEILVAVGAELEERMPLLRIKTAPAPNDAPPARPAPQETARQQQVELAPVPAPSSPQAVPVSGGRVHAGPAVRKQARQYGVDLGRVRGTGRRNRIQKDDVRAYVRERLRGDPGSGTPALPKIPLPDFSRFGQTELLEMPRIRRTSARNLHRSWLNLPQVTHFDQADISELEAFRKSENLRLKDSGVKLTVLAFLIRAAIRSLQAFPNFNSSLNEEASSWILKKYYNIGIAVDTPTGLLVPVVRQADRKSLAELATASAELAAGAREGGLPLDAFQGGTFSISSLGGIGGTGFTPLVNAPEVAILGVSRSEVKPVWDGSEFVQRLILPISLTYDHRAIDGAEAARFMVHLAAQLEDPGLWSD